MTTTLLLCAVLLQAAAPGPAGSAPPGRATPPASAAPPANAAPPVAPAPAAAPGSTTAPAAPAHDSIRVLAPTASADLLKDPQTRGRIKVFFASTDARVNPGDPCEGPFWEAPQPIFSVGVDALTPGKAVDVGVDAAFYPVPMDQLAGTWRVQAVLDRDETERTHLAPGNLLSQVETVTFDPATPQTVTLELTTVVPKEALSKMRNLQFVHMKSALLSQAAGRDVYMRAGVALPPGWDDPSCPRRMWPTVYVVPGFGGRDMDAERYARMLSTPGSTAVAPQAVWVVLDPESAWGHHGFVDSPANGPRGQALVEELIPELERQFRLISRTEARLVTGHSSGGWTALWLQLRYPEVFGACFASSPDPVDFSAFQMVNLYADTSYFSDAEGKERPSYRTTVAQHFDKVHMTNRDETGMEHAMDPDGRSGEQLDTYAAMWSALDPRTRLPRRAWDPETGLIDHGTVEREWSRYDITRLVRTKPEYFVPLFRQRVRLLVGQQDNFYLELAVANLKATLDQVAPVKEGTGGAAGGAAAGGAGGAASGAGGAAGNGAGSGAGAGYIEILPEETHFTIPGTATLRWNREIREYLKQHGLD